MVMMQLHKDVPLDEGEALAKAHGGVALSPIAGIHGMTVWLPKEQISALAAEEAVLWIEPGPEPLTQNNDGVREAMQVDALYDAPYNLSGAGVRVFVFDAGTVRATHSTFNDGSDSRVTLIDSTIQHYHATHVAGIVAGDGNGGRAQGVAPAATILSAGYEQITGTMFFWDNAGDIEADYARARNQYAADFATNSLGSNTAANGYPCSREGDYGVTSSLLDGIVRGDNAAVGDAVLMSWANGNERIGGTFTPGRCGQNYATTAPPACAKNPIHVGAINSDHETMTSFSSWGPCDDGRLKPIVSAPGCQLGREYDDTETGVYSSMSTNDDAFEAHCGTSMAAPAAAGVLALMMEDWRAQGYGGTYDRPLPALFKAMLIHTAQDLGPDGPDYSYGYGKINAKAAVDLIRAGNALGAAGPVNWGTESIAQGETDGFTVDVPVGAPAFKVSLAWDDYAAAAYTTNALVNDLNLEVVAPDGVVHYYPFVLNPAAPYAAATTGVNTVDNQEQVIVENPVAGVWTVRVVGAAVPQGPQPYGLVYESLPTTYVKMCNEQMLNGGFETAGDWTLSGAVRDTARAHGGNYALKLGGIANSEQTAYQEINIPAEQNGRAELSFWWLMTNTPMATRGEDHFYAEVRDTDGRVLGTFDFRSDAWLQGQWLESENMDLREWAGQTVRLYFVGINSGSDPSTFWVDDVSLETCYTASPAGAGWLQGMLSDATTSTPLANIKINARTGGVAGITSASTDANGYYRMPLTANTYTITVSLYGYTPVEIPNIHVTAQTTTTQNIALSPVTQYTLRGAVTDANTGWPLYAEVEIIPQGYAPFKVWSDPWSGIYSATVMGNHAHTLNVTPWHGIAGYQAQSRTVSLTANRSNENFTLAADMGMCQAPGYYPIPDPYQFGTSFLTEEFTTWPLPAGWKIVNNLSAHVWHAGSTDEDDNRTGGEGDYAYTGSAGADTELRTPALDFIAQTEEGLTLEFKTDMPQGSSNIWDVEASLDGGESWDALLHCEGECYPGPETVTLSLMGYEGQSNVRLRFHFQGEPETGWQIDEVRVYDPDGNPLFEEDFETWPLPAGWDIVDNSAHNVWYAGATDNMTGGSGTYAYADNSLGDESKTIDTELWTPILDLSEQSDPALFFRSDMSSYLSDTWDVDMSLNGGDSWDINLLHREGQDYPGPEDIILPLTGAGGRSAVRLRFHYRGNPGRYWQVDDVGVFEVGGILGCAIPSGGLVAGNIYDGNTGLGVTGAIVRNRDGYTAKAQTTEQTTLSDGFYVIYSPAGNKTFTAITTQYNGAVVADRAVVAGETQDQDFWFYTGKIAVEPNALNAWIQAGDSATFPLTLTNNGVQGMTFNIYEWGGAITDTVCDGGFEGGSPSAYWNEYSQIRDTPLCSPSNGCPDLARTGEWYLLFGLTEDAEIAYVEQTFTIPASYATLDFWWAVYSPHGEDISGMLTVSLDNQTLFEVTETDVGYDYAPVSLDVSNFADGERHTLRFNAKKAGNGYLGLLIDDVALRVNEGPDWLSKVPAAGNLDPINGMEIVSVTFDAGLLSTGSYTGGLYIMEDTLGSAPRIPIQIIVGNTYTSQQSGSWSDSAWAEGSPKITDRVTIMPGHVVTLDAANARCYSLHIAPGGTLVIPAGNTLTIESEMVNEGTLRQTKTISGNGVVDYHIRNQAGAVMHYGPRFMAIGYALGNTVVDIHGAIPQGTGTLNETAARWFEITPQYPANGVGVPVYFYYDEAELNGNDPATLDVYHYGGSGDWTMMPTLSRGGAGAARWVYVEIGADGYSPFVLKSPSAPTPVGLSVFEARDGILATLLGFAAATIAMDAVRRKRPK